MIEKHNIPSSWIQVPMADLFLNPINDIVSGPFGSNLKASEYLNEGVPVIRIQNIDRNRFIDKKINYISEEKAEFLSRHNFQSGDIIITKLGDPVGKTSLVPDKYERGIIVADLVRARVNHKYINKKFLVYQLNSSFLIKQFDKHTKGTTRPRVKLSIIRELIFNLPPLNEQNRIVDAIDELFSDLDNGVLNLNKVPNQLKVYRQALLKSAFEGKLTEQWRKSNNPEPTEKLLKLIEEDRRNRYEKELENWKEVVKTWEEGEKKENKPKKPKNFNEFPNPKENSLSKSSYAVTLGNICKKINKLNRKNKNSESNIKYVDIGSINNSTFSITTFKEYNLSEAPSRAQQIIKVGDTLFSNVRTYLRNIALVNDSNLNNAICSSGFTVLRPENRIKAKYLFYYSLSEVFIHKINELQKGTSYPAVRDSDILEQSFPLCSEEEQIQIINIVESQFSILENLEQTIMEGLSKAGALRQSILKKAFEGKLVNQDQKDEPASEMLKRIQNEKKKYMEKQKQQKKKAPKKLKKMSKELSIEEVLNTSDKPMFAKDVWQKSKHKDNIEEFYAELKKIQENIKEVKKGTESLLTLTK
jgi:type I restriction enzyme S subunit